MPPHISSSLTNQPSFRPLALRNGHCQRAESHSGSAPVPWTLALVTVPPPPPLPCFPLRQPSRHRKRKLLSQVKDLRTLLRSSPSQCFSSARPLCCGANLGLLVFGSSLEVNLVIDDLEPFRTAPSDREAT